MKEETSTKEDCASLVRRWEIFWLANFDSCRTRRSSVSSRLWSEYLHSLKGWDPKKKTEQRDLREFHKNNQKQKIKLQLSVVLQLEECLLITIPNMSLIKQTTKTKKVTNQKIQWAEHLLCTCVSTFVHFAVVHGKQQLEITTYAFLHNLSYDG